MAEYQEHSLLFQRTGVQFPRLTAWLTVALIASSGLYRHQADTEYTGIHTNHHTKNEKIPFKNTHIHYNKWKIKTSRV